MLPPDDDELDLALDRLMAPASEPVVETKPAPRPPAEIARASQPIDPQTRSTQPMSSLAKPSASRAKPASLPPRVPPPIPPRVPAPGAAIPAPPRVPAVPPRRAARPVEMPPPEDRTHAGVPPPPVVLKPRPRPPLHGPPTDVVPVMEEPPPPRAPTGSGIPVPVVRTNASAIPFAQDDGETVPVVSPNSTLPMPAAGQLPAQPAIPQAVAQMISSGSVQIEPSSPTPVVDPQTDPKLLEFFEQASGEQKPPPRARRPSQEPRGRASSQMGAIASDRVSGEFPVVRQAPAVESAPHQRISGEFPVSRPRRPQTPSGSTSVLPGEQPGFAKPEQKSGTGRVRREPRPPIEIGENTTIDRFGLIREIARGGMGQVFLARDTKLGRKVAIKFLLHDDPAFAQRFLIEARATARCTHENIVAIYEVGEHEGLPYMVLEYLEGKTLSQVLETKPGPRAFAEIMLSVSRALERAHEHGIVHRDLKPSNIFVTDRGQVKVLDFGVARIFDSAGDALEKAAAQASKNWGSNTPDGERNTYVTFSGGGTLVGTLPYMSPEQWGADVVDHQSDIWACGIMFWRALTGVHPAGTMNADKLKVRLTDLDTPLPSLAARDPSIPYELVQIVDRCLRKYKSERYQNATEMIVDLQAFLAPKAERISEDVCPYRGLASFGEADAKYFFGRSNEIRTAISHLDAWPLLAVIGPSGVGKSSFVHAGLVPAIRAQGGNWQVRMLRPGRSPLESLAGTIDEVIDGQDAEFYIDQLHDAPGEYGELLRKAARRKKHKVLIIVDQLEELFTLSDNDEVRKTFLASLLAAADDVTSPVRVVLSMRADFLDRLAGHKHFLSELSRGLFFLSAPDLDNLRETLVRPAELAGYTFADSWIVEDMMQAATSKGALPLLQFAATRLWDARDRTKRQLTVHAYNQMGGVGGAFARHADEIAQAIPPQSQGLLRSIMTRLVTAEGTRAVVDHKELLGLSKDRKDVERVLDHLVRGRLIHMHTDAMHGTTVEIVHEVLISEWPMLARWLEDSQSLRGFMQELRQATKQWQSRGKRHDLVWRGVTAQDALATAKRHVLDLSSAEKEFLNAMRAGLARSRRRKIYWLTIILLLLLGGLGAAGFFTMQLRQANEDTEAALVEAQRQTHVAKAAEAKVQAQLDAVQAAQRQKEAAEADAMKAEAEAKTKAEEALKANAQVAQSKEDLQKTNVLLKQQVEEAQKAKEIAQEQSKKAAAAKEAAEKATADAKAANARTQALLAAEKERVRQLEAEKSKISTGGLK